MAFHLQIPRPMPRYTIQTQLTQPQKAWVVSFYCLLKKFRYVKGKLDVPIHMLSALKENEQRFRRVFSDRLRTLSNENKVFLRTFLAVARVVHDNQPKTSKQAFIGMFVRDLVLVLESDCKIPTRREIVAIDGLTALN
jgi:hypothetical protein